MSDQGTQTQDTGKPVTFMGLAIPGPLAARFPLLDFFETVARKPVPANLSWDFCLGSVCLFLLVNQLVTGTLLTVYYRPTVGEAYESVQYIQEEIPFGWLVRQLHAWGANLMILFLVLHMARVIFWGSYKTPRELNWFVGLGLLGLTLTLGFTGYLLPWDQLSYWASKVGTEIPGAVPVVGHTIMRLMRAGDEIGQPTLSRFFALHVIVLPATILGLVVLHLVLMRIHGISGYPGSEKGPKVPFFPNHVAKDGALVFVVLAVLYALVVILPWELHDKANPLDTPEGVKPEWYFLWTYQLLKYFPTEIGPITGKLLGLGVSGLMMAVLVALPFIDRGTDRQPRRRRKALRLVGALTIVVLALTVLGHVCENEYTVLGMKIQLDIRGFPHIESR